MDLTNKFIRKLHERIPKHKDLVSYIAEKLNIERDSANRRLNGKVQFTIKELEILCQNLQISLDDLIKNHSEVVFPILGIKNQLHSISMEEYLKSIDSATELFEYLTSKTSHAGIIFSSLPLEFTLNYPCLNKFILYKWGYFYTGSEYYNNFSEWEIPERLKEINYRLMNALINFDSLLYIWNPITIITTIKEIQFFRTISAMNKSDTEFIKKELHLMLNYLEGIAKGNQISYNNDKIQKIEFYVSNINHNLDFYYYLSGDEYYTFFTNYFLTSKLSNNDCGDAIFQLEKSLKKVSALISESGERERKIFFKEQHEYIDNF